MSNHTPGPWQDDDSGDYVTTARVIRRNGIIVCRMECRYPMTKEEYNANTRLIAEAPALRELLARAVEVLDAEGIVYGNSQDEPLDVLSTAQALLARIDGTETGS